MGERFPGSKAYWEERYRSGGHSGRGSRGDFARFKAKHVNEFVERQRIRSVIEFGCGDGEQLKLLKVPSYLGLDVSPTAIRLCQDLFRRDPLKTFKTMEEYKGEKADLALSLDVIFHLIEDDVFEEYMTLLFNSATRYVMTYSTDSNKGSQYPHIRYRKYSTWVNEHIAGWAELYRIAGWESRPESFKWGYHGFIVWAPVP